MAARLTWLLCDVDFKHKYASRALKFSIRKEKVNEFKTIVRLLKYILLRVFIVITIKDQIRAKCDRHGPVNHNEKFAV